MAFVEKKWKLLDHFIDNNLCTAQSQVHARISIFQPLACLPCSLCGKRTMHTKTVRCNSNM